MSWVALVAGLVSGFCTALALYPLDFLETRQQLDGAATRAAGKPAPEVSLARQVVRVVRRHGISGLYRGVVPAVVGITINWGVYSFLYACFLVWTPQLWSASSPTGRTVWTDLLAGMATGVCTCWVVNPFWVVKVRLAQSSSAGALSCIRGVLAEGGLAGFWAGVVPSMFGCLEGALQFLLLEQAKALDIRSTLVWAVVGALARITGVTVCYPYQVTRTKMQSQPSRSGSAGKTHAAASGAGGEVGLLVATIGATFRTEGVAGFYAGLIPRLWREALGGALYTAVSYVVTNLLTT